MNRGLSSSELSLLGRMRNAILATTGPHGSPHLAPVWYLWDGEAVRISTVRTTQKVADILRDPRVALCVDDQVAGEYLTIYGIADGGRRPRGRRTHLAVVVALPSPGRSIGSLGQDRRQPLPRVDLHNAGQYHWPSRCQVIGRQMACVPTGPSWVPWRLHTLEERMERCQQRNHQSTRPPAATATRGSKQVVWSAPGLPACRA